MRAGGESTLAEGWLARPVGRRREDRFVGGSRDSERLIDQAMACARSDQPVLLVGAPGVGKQFTARAIHAWSERAGGPFVRLALAALPPARQARDLFGAAAAGSADAERAGAFEHAEKGTLLLDGIEHLGKEVGTELVNALREQAFRRVGEAASRPLRCRLIASAEQPLAEPCFGSLLHHEIAIASLSERRDDILPLAAHFLASAAAELGLKPVGFTLDARAFLLAEPWPGNVRELRERVRQALQISPDGAISADSLRVASEQDDIPSFKDAKRAFETQYVVSLLRRCGGNISRAARLAKKDRKDFYDVIRRTGVDPAQFRS
jgi:two-component system response regulator GlrR